MNRKIPVDELVRTLKVRSWRDPEHPMRRAARRAGIDLGVLEDGVVVDVPTVPDTSEDLAGFDEDPAWVRLGRTWGIHPGSLRRLHNGRKRPGETVYIPSADDRLVMQLMKRTRGQPGRALHQLRQLQKGHNVRMLRAARHRCQGVLGQGYANVGDSSVWPHVFWSPNLALNGARGDRRKRILGDMEYAVAWGADFWKCSVYVQDVVHSAGYRPHVTDHGHYLVAGQLHQSPQFAVIAVADARPGDLWQRWGGDGIEDSHNGVLESFVRCSEVRPGVQRWQFRIFGAELAGAGVSQREHEVLTPAPGATEATTTEGRILRFLRPA